MKKNRGKQRQCKSRLQEIKMKMFDRNFRNKRKKSDEINERKKCLTFKLAEVVLSQSMIKRR